MLVETNRGTYKIVQQRPRYTLWSMGSRLPVATFLSPEEARHAANSTCEAPSSSDGDFDSLDEVISYAELLIPGWEPRMECKTSERLMLAALDQDDIVRTKDAVRLAIIAYRLECQQAP